MKPNSTIKEQSLNPQLNGRSQSQVVDAAETLDDRLLLALHAAGEKKAIEIVILDLRDVATFTDYFVITSGANERQVQAISDGISETLKKAGSAAARVEGYKTAEWILLDYGDFVVHVFEQKARSFYDLERLWRAARRVVLPPEFDPESVSSLRRES